MTLKPIHVPSTVVTVPHAMYRICLFLPFYCKIICAYLNNSGGVGCIKEMRGSLNDSTYQSSSLFPCDLFLSATYVEENRYF